MKKIRYSILVMALATGLAGPAASASAGEIGGWGEQEGAFVYEQDSSPLPVRGTQASAKHTGQSETKVINGTTNKRSHGWTTWSGVYHYTTARLEHTWPSSGVIATSGRVWGNNGTEAISPWKAFNPNAASSGYGSAKTYYGS